MKKNPTDSKPIWELWKEIIVQDRNVKTFLKIKQNNKNKKHFVTKSTNDYQERSKKKKKIALQYGCVKQSEPGNKISKVLAVLMAKFPRDNSNKDSVQLWWAEEHFKMHQT